MAVVGTAYVDIRAVGNKFAADIKNIIDSSLSGAAVDLQNSLDGVSSSSDRLGNSSRNSSGNLGSMAEVLTTVATGGQGSGSALSSLTTVLSNLAQGAGGVSQAISGVSQGMGQVSRANDDAGNSANNVSRGMGRASEALDDAGDAADNGSSALQRFGQQSSGARKQLDMMILTGNVTAQVIVQLGGAIGALVSGLFSLGSAVAFAAQSLIVLPALLGAVVQGALTLALAFQGVGAAIGAGFQASTKSGARAARSGSDNARAIELALRRLRDAYQSAEESAVKNLRNVAAAEQDLSDAVNNSIALQEKLTRARIDAAEAAQQLAFSVEEAALSEERAGMALETAQRQLRAVQSLPPDNTVRRDVELTFKEAELNYREAKDRNADLTEEQRKSAEAGIEGSQEVLAVKNDIVEADKKVIESQAALMKALEEQAIATRESKEAIADALSDLAYARRQGGAAAAGAAGAVNKFQEALTKLSPAQREFVKFIVSLKPMFDKLKNAVGDGFFPPVTAALKDLFKEKGATSFFNQLKDAFVNTAAVLGDFVAGLIDLFKNPFFRKQFFDLMQSNATILGTIGSVMADLGAIIVYVLKAAAPLTLEFSKWIQTLTSGYRASLETTGGIAKLSDTFSRAGNVAKIVFGWFSALWGVLKGLGGAALPSGIYLFKQFTETLTDLEASIKGNTKGFEDFFNSSALNFQEIMKLAGGLVKILFKLGASPKFNEALKKYQEAIPLLEKIAVKVMDAAPAFAALVVQVVKLIDALTQTGAMNAFFDTLRIILQVLTPIIGFFASFAGAIFSVLVAFRLVGYAAMFFARAVFGPLVAGFNAVRGPVVQVVNLLGGWRKVLQIVGRLILGMFSGITLAGAAVAAGVVLAIAIVAGAVVSVMKYNKVLKDSKKAREDFQKKYTLEGLDNLRDKTDKTRQAIQDLNKAYSLEAVKSPREGWNRFTRVLGDVIKEGVTGKSTLEGLNAELAANEAALKATDGPIKELAAQYGLAESSVRLLSVGVLDSNASYIENKIALEDAITSTVRTKIVSTDLMKAQKVLADETSTAADRTNALRTALDLLDGGFINTQAASDNLKGAFADATAGIKENGRTLSDNTEKGRNNRAALRDIAGQIKDLTTATYDNVLATSTATTEAGKKREADIAVNTVLRQQRDKFVALAEKMGASKTEAEGLADKMGLLKGLIVVPKVEVSITAKDAASKTFFEDIKSWSGTSFGIVVRGRRIATQEAGGPVVKGRPYIVGEKRPELFVPTQSGVIIPKIPGLSANMFGRSTILDQLKNPYMLAAGGLISPSSSGTLALLAEAGRAERVTPLDSNGFTPAERQILAALQGDSSEKDINIQVFVGNQQIQDIVDVKMNGKSVRDARRTKYSRPVN